MCTGVAALTLAFAAAATPPGAELKTYGTVTVMHLMVEIPQTPPLTNLHNFQSRNFTYALYPTAADGAHGAVPGNVATGAPMVIALQGGNYDHHLDAHPVEFDITDSQLATKLEKAQGQIAEVVFAVLYTGAGSSNCTGIVDVLELSKGHLILEDQVNYDCRGGGGAEYDNANHLITVNSARYSAGDKDCCPSSFDTIELRMNGAGLRAADVETIGQQETPLR